MYIIGAVIVVIIIVVIFMVCKKQGGFTAEQENTVDRKARSWDRVFTYPMGANLQTGGNQGAANGTRKLIEKYGRDTNRMSPNVKMPTLNGVDESGTVYADRSAQKSIGGTEAGLAWVL